MNPDIDNNDESDSEPGDDDYFTSDEGNDDVVYPHWSQAPQQDDDNEQDLPPDHDWYDLEPKDEQSPVDPKVTEEEEEEETPPIPPRGNPFKDSHIPQSKTWPNPFSLRCKDKEDWNQLPTRRATLPSSRAPLHQSEREHKITHHPGNVFRERRPPSEILCDLKRKRYWKRIVDDDGTLHPNPHRHTRNTPGAIAEPPADLPIPPMEGYPRIPDNFPPMPEHFKKQLDEQETSQLDKELDEMEDVEFMIKKLLHEGGDNFLQHFLNKAAVPTSDVPIHYRDIEKMPKEEQTMWCEACLQELEAL
ncbi:hypothetical protein AX17_006508 [Amanita inopinata Kibby_2008]|nr:hypothetical protein AX17_006508 [Amanita inopinata Kibby_2008]